MTRLENWKFSNYINWFQYPTEDRLQIIGNVYDYITDKFADGTEVRTSEVLTFNADNLIVETLNTTYQLGQIDEDFKEFVEKNGFSLKDYSKNFL